MAVWHSSWLNKKSNMAKSYRSNPWYLDVHFLTNHQRPSSAASLVRHAALWHSVLSCLSRHLVCVQWVEISCNLSGQKKNISDQTNMKSKKRLPRSLFEWPSNYFNQGTYCLMVTPQKNVLEFPPKNQKQAQKKDVLEWLKPCQTTQKIIGRWIARKNLP